MRSQLLSLFIISYFIRFCFSIRLVSSSLTPPIAIRFVSDISYLASWSIRFHFWLNSFGV